MRRLIIATVTVLLSIILCHEAQASGYIKGQLIQLPGAEATVTFFNSENAEIANSTRTTKGAFVSAPLPAGQYKVHFSAKVDTTTTCYDEFLGPQDTYENVFDTARIISVVDGQDTDLGELAVFGSKGYYCGPMQCFPNSGAIQGAVMDSKTSAGIPGIRVQFKNPITAFPKFAELTTDSNGQYFLSVKLVCEALDVKVRFSDPHGIYSPEYYRSGGVDSFAQGRSVDFTETTVKIDEDLAQLSPAQQIGGLLDDVQTVLPPEDAQPLVSSLEQGQALLEDANPNNDKGACGVLTGTGQKIDNLVSRGLLSQNNADALMAKIDALKMDLGCKK